MVEAGILGETDRVELEGGVLVELEPSGGPHGSRVTWLSTDRPHAAEGYVVRVQDTFLIPDGGFYEPDIVVGPPTGDDVPRTAGLVIEVAVSSRRRDREKAAVYAAAGVTEYWIVDVAHSEVVVHRDPQSTEATAPCSRTVPRSGSRRSCRLPKIDVAALLRGT